MPQPGALSAAAFDPRATTRTARSVRTRSSDHLVRLHQIVESPGTRLRYRIERLLGEGGFGQVFLATRLGRSTKVPRDVCIKVSTHVDAWIREAYFGQLLDDHPRAIRLYDRFPLTLDGRLAYALVLECA